MKKHYLFLVLILLIVSTSTFGKITRSFYDSSELKRWNFKFDIGHSFGFNLDSTVFGMESQFEMNIESVIAPKHTEKFISRNNIGDTDLVGVIQVKHFSMKFGIDDVSAENDKTEYVTPNIKWGKISGTVYFGPIFIILTAQDHDKELDVSVLDDDILRYSNINYSVIPIKTTINYKEQQEITEEVTKIFSTKSTFGTNESGLIDEQENGALQLGYNFEDIFELRIGFSTQYSYEVFEGKTGLMPFALTTIFDFTPLERVSFKLFNAVISGVNGKKVLQTENPLALGTMFGYTFSIGPNLFLTTNLGFSFAFSWDKIMDPEFAVKNNPINSSKNTNVFSLPLELTASAVLDWRYLGLFEKEDDYLSFNTSVSDIVTDGVGLATTFGFTQHTVFRGLNIPYLGLKVTLWEYEFDSVNNDTFDNVQPRTNSLVKNLAVAFIGNVNYSFGNTYHDFHQYVDAYANATSSEIKIAPRLDYGFVLDTSYKLNFLKHKLGIIIKEFDALRGTDIYKVDGHFNEAHTREFINRLDVRLKFGYDVINIFQNFTLNIDWVSGNLTKEGERVLTNYNDYDFFKTNNASNNVSFDTNAVLGYISFGFVYRFGN